MPDSSATPQAQENLETQIQLADLMSTSLLFSVQRQYLDIPFGSANFIQPLPPMIRHVSTEDPVFLRLEQVGGLGSGSQNQPLTALQTALSACHHPGRFTLIFLITGNGLQNNIYLGVRPHGPQVYVDNFVSSLGNFMRGNWPGTRLSRCYVDEPDFKRDVTDPLTRDFRHAIALTGIPSLKPGDQVGYPQSLDRMLRGLRNVPFTYMVVAEPIAPDDVHRIVHQCRSLIGQVHALTKTTASETLSKGISKTESRGESWSKSVGTGTTDSRGINIGGGLGVMFPPAAFLGALASGIGNNASISPSIHAGWQKGHAETHSESSSYGGSSGVSVGMSLSAAHTLGHEYLNAHAVAAESILRQYVERFESASAVGCWNVGVYFLAKTPDLAQQGGTQLRALLSGEKTVLEPIRVHDLKRVWNGCAQPALGEFEQPALALTTTDPAVLYLDHPLGPAFNGLTTPLSTGELSLLVNLPRREVPGIPIVPVADFSLNLAPQGDNALQLGHLLEGGEPTNAMYTIPPRLLAKHALITGITGSGKSITCQSLLTEMHRSHIPFLVVEPAKDEYVEWAMKVNAQLPPDSPDRISIYMPGTLSWRGQALAKELVLNPFDIVWLSETSRPQVLSHIDRLKSILVAAFPMQEVLPILLEEALFELYEQPSRNWLTDKLPPFGTPRPTLAQLVNSIRELVTGKSYDKPVAANLEAALTSRINSLRLGWKKQLFDQPVSTPWPDLFDHPAVINLSCLGDDADIALTMSILLQFLYEYRRAQREANVSTPQSLQHVMVIEEAHRVLGRAIPGLPGYAQPQVKVAEMFANVLSEIRAYGEGILIVDQVPAKLIPDAIKNTNLKIVHRLVAIDDRDALAGGMTLTPDQAAVISRLRQGQAIVYGDSDDVAAWVKIIDRSTNI